jgi:hypothetical protein
VIYQKYRKCRTCGCVGGLFITRKHRLKTTGKIVVYVGIDCHLCANEKSNLRHHKLWKDPKRKEAKKLKNAIYRLEYPERRKKSNHNWYMKNREKRAEKYRQTYVPKERNPLRKGSGAHHRIPAPDHYLRGFDFRSIKTMQEA